MKRIAVLLAGAILAAAAAYEINRRRYPVYNSYDELLAEIEREGEALAPDPYLAARFPHLYRKSTGTWSATTPPNVEVTWK